MKSKYTAYVLEEDDWYVMYYLPRIESILIVECKISNGGTDKDHVIILRECKQSDIRGVDLNRLPRTRIDGYRLFNNVRTNNITGDVIHTTSGYDLDNLDAFGSL